MADNIEGGGNGLGGLAQLIGALSPLFIGNKQQQTVSGNPNDIAANNAFIQQLMPRATGGVDSAIYSPIVQNIMRRAAIAFAPTRGMQTVSGGYNSTALKQLSDEAQARASGEAASAVLQSQSDASKTIAQLLSANTAADRTIKTKTPPQINPALTLGLLALGGARQLFPKTTGAVAGSVKNAAGSFEDSIMNLFRKPQGLGSDAGPDVGGGISYGGGNAFAGSGAGGGSTGSLPSFLTGEDELSGFGGVSNNELGNIINAASTNAGANAAAPFFTPAVVSADAVNGDAITQPYNTAALGAGVKLEGPAAAPGTGEGYTGGGFNPEQAGKVQTAQAQPGYTGTALNVAGTGAAGQFSEAGANAIGSVGINAANVGYAAGAKAAQDEALDTLLSPDLYSSTAAESVGQTAGQVLPYVGPAVQVALGNYGSAAGSLVGGYVGGPIGAGIGGVLGSASGPQNSLVRSGRISDDPENPLSGATQSFSQIDQGSYLVDSINTGSFGKQGPGSIGDALAPIDDLGHLPINLAQEGGVGDVVDFVSDFGGKLANNIGTVICTELYRQGKLTRKEYAADMRWGITHVSPTTFRGYHFWAKPVVAAMRKSATASKISAFFFLPWAKQLSGERTVYGAILRVVGPAICYVLGSVLEVLDPQMVEA